MTNLHKLPIKLIDAGIARGKTTAIINHLAERKRAKAIIATQQRSLSKEIQFRLVAAGVNPFEISVIMSDPEKHSCTARFWRALEDGSRRIIIVDQSIVFAKYQEKYVSKYARKNGPYTGLYDLYIDEVPKIETTYRLKKLPKFFQDALAPMFDHGVTDDVRFYRLKLTSDVVSMIEAVINHDRSYTDEDISKFSADFIKLCYALRNYGDVIVECDAKELLSWKDGKTDFLTLHHTYHPTILSDYRSVTIAAANVGNSEMYQIWKDKADFKTHPLSKTLRKDVSEIKSQSVNIHYLSDKFGSWKKLSALGYQEFLDQVAETFQEKFGDIPHIFCTRKQDENGRPYKWSLEGEDCGIRVSSNVKGVNTYKHVHAALFLAPINPPTKIYNRKIARYELTGEDVKESVAYEQQYQFVARTSLRDHDSDAELNFIVLDKASAEALQRKFKCADPKPLDIGVPALWEQERNFDAAKAREKSRQNKQEYRLRKKTILNDRKNAAQYDDFHMIHWSSKESHGLSQVSMTWNDIVSSFENDANGLSLPRNAPHPLFREGALKDHSNHKLRGNIQTTKLIILDIDDSKIGPKPLSDFFNENEWTHFIYGSKSHNEQLSSFRVVIPLSEAVNADNYRRIVDLLVTDIDLRFNEAYPIDRSKLTINCKFNSPTIPESGFKLFIKCDHKKLFAVQFVNVEWFLSRHDSKKDAENNVLEAPVAHNGDSALPEIESIISKWSVRPGEGKGNQSLFNCVVELKRAGWSASEITPYLVAACAANRFGRGSDRDAKTTINDVFSWRKMAA